MVDDIRPREPELPEEQNKNSFGLQTPEPPQDTEPAFVPPDLIHEEDGFVSVPSDNVIDRATK